MWRSTARRLPGGQLRQLRGGLPLLLLIGSLLGSCYSPDFGRLIYKCDTGKICPEGLSCIDGKHCTSATAACVQGGILIAPDTFVCPGDGNLCAPGYKQCPISVTTNLCHLDVSDGGKPEGCAICCGDYGDMSRSAPVG
jgi:hypothetical protein